MSEGGQDGGRKSGLARRPGRGGPQATGNRGSQMQFSSDSLSLKVSPTMVLVLSLGFMLSVVALHVMGKMKATVAGA